MFELLKGYDELSEDMKKTQYSLNGKIVKSSKVLEEVSLFQEFVIDGEICIVVKINNSLDGSIHRDIELRNLESYKNQYLVNTGSYLRLVRDK